MPKKKSNCLFSLPTPPFGAFPGFFVIVAQVETLVPILSPALKCWGTPDGRSYVANLPTCGPLLIFSHALKRWGPRTRLGFCSQSNHLWVIVDSPPCSKALGTPGRQGLCSKFAHLLAISPLLNFGDHPDGGLM